MGCAVSPAQGCFGCVPQDQKSAVGWGAALMHHPKALWRSRAQRRGSTQELWPFLFGFCTTGMGRGAGGQQAAMAWTAAPASCPGSCMLWMATSPLRSCMDFNCSLRQRWGGGGGCESEQPVWSCRWPCPSFQPYVQCPSYPHCPQHGVEKRPKAEGEGSPGRQSSTGEP